MPNHIHGIIIINNNSVGEQNLRSQYENFHPQNNNIIQNNIKDVRDIKDARDNRDDNNRPLRNTNLSNVIKGFKIGLTKWCKKNSHSNFKWQRSFYDRIIRNEKELFNIRKYINQNPLKWDIEKSIANLEF